MENEQNFLYAENNLKKTIAKEEAGRKAVEAEKTIVDSTKDKNSKIAKDIQQ